LPAPGTERLCGWSSGERTTIAGTDQAGGCGCSVIGHRDAGYERLEALKTLREAYSPIELPVIMVTAKNQSEDIVKALDLGANDYLTKPVDFPVALARIATQLSHKRAQEALRESEERYALAARAPTTAFGTGIC